MSYSLFSAINRSNMSGGQKSEIRHWLDKLTGGKASEALRHSGLSYRLADNGLDALLLGGEAVGTGVGLAYVNNEMGLDFGPIPLDFVSGVLALGVYGFTRSFHAGNVAASSLSVYGFRKMDAYLKAKKAASGSSMHGEEDGSGVTVETDPIAKAAQAL